MIGSLQRPEVHQESEHGQRGRLELGFAVSLWDDAPGAGAAAACEGRQPGAGSDARGSPAGLWEGSCFEEASADTVFRLHLPSRPGWLSCLEQGRLSIPGVHSSAQQLHLTLWSAEPWMFAWVQVAWEARRKMPALRIESEQSLQSVGSDIPLPSPCWWSTQSVLEWNLCVSHPSVGCLFCVSHLAGAYSRLHSMKLALKESLWIWGKCHLVL